MDFSRKSSWDRRLNPLAVRLESLQAQGAPLLDLTESNPTRCGFVYPAREIASAIQSAELLLYQPDPKGLATARHAIARHLSRGGFEQNPDHLILCSGTSDCYAYLFKLLCNPGDNVLIPNPSYPLFDFLTGLEAVEARPYALHFDGGWRLDTEEIAGRGDQRTRALLVVNPGNPTGVFLKRSELESIAALCESRSWSLIVDEVFSDYSQGADPDRVDAVAAHETSALTFVLSGLSKAAGLPQLKVAWLSVSGPPSLRDEALERLEIIADTYLAASTIVQSAIPKLLPLCDAIQSQIRERIALNRSALRAARTQAAWSILPAEGGWYATLRLPDSTREESVCLDLLERGVIVHPGYFFDFPEGHFLVLSLIPRPEIFARGMEELARALE